MKSILSISLLLCIAMTSCDFGVIGNGNVEERTENIDKFSRLYIEGNFDVYLTQDSKATLRIEADENLQDIIHVHQDGDRLTIESEENILRAKKKSLHISYPDLAKLVLTGAIDVYSKNPIEVRSLTIICSGAINMNLDILTDKLRLDISGAANCNLEGVADEVILELSGAGNFNAIDLKTKSMSIDLSGAAHARVFATEKLDVEISGAGVIKYKGDPEVRKSISGLGSLRKY